MIYLVAETISYFAFYQLDVVWL